MTLNELHGNFDLEVDKSGIIANSPSFLPEEKDYFLNTAIQRIIKTRYSGVNSHKTGFQQDQKRSDDLRTVVKSVALSDSDFTISIQNDITSYSMQYPVDYFIGLGESVFIEPISNIDPSLIKRTDVLECTIENIDSKLSDSLSAYRFHHGSAKPARVYFDDKIYLYTDGNYSINRYVLTYLFLPAKLDWYTDDKTIELTIMPEHMWDEILVSAVQLALLNTSDDRFVAYSQEAQVIE